VLIIVILELVVLDFGAFGFLSVLSSEKHLCFVCPSLPLNMRIFPVHCFDFRHCFCAFTGLKTESRKFCETFSHCVPLFLAVAAFHWFIAFWFMVRFKILSLVFIISDCINIIWVSTKILVNEYYFYTISVCTICTNWQFLLILFKNEFNLHGFCFY
jgi:hypothetical protein